MAALAGAAAPALAQACKAQSGAVAPVVVELYTSEGCNSCPPADRWVSSLKERPGVLAVAFHVDYWDRLGWKDRFASARYTERQALSQAHSGARFSYTPQVQVNGRDWRRWPELPAAGVPAPVQIAMQRESDQVAVNVMPLNNAPTKLALWWVGVEDGHASEVKAGENHGVTLRHDGVVRHYGTVPAWSGAAVQRISVPARGEGARPIRVLAVVTDAANGKPLQAVQLSCPI